MAGYDLDELVETLSAAGDPQEEVVRRAVVRQTLAAVAALPERQREALLRTAVEGLGRTRWRTTWGCRTPPCGRSCTEPA